MNEPVDPDGLPAAQEPDFGFDAASRAAFGPASSAVG
jgi:hypothetical protein